MNAQPQSTKHDIWRTLIASLPGLIFGAVGGYLLTELTKPASDEYRVILASFFVVCLLLSILSIYIIVYARRGEEREELWLKAIGTPAELIFEHVDSNRGEYYRRLINIVEMASAGDEILIMSQHKVGESVSAEGEPEARKQAREMYSRVLLQKAREPGITYHRIICFDEGAAKGEVKTGRLKGWLLEHCADMLEIKKAKRDKISLKKASTKINADIFVLSGKIGTIVVDIIESPSTPIFTNGALIFHNPPNGRVIEQLREWFLEIDADEETLPVKSVELNKTPA